MQNMSKLYKGYNSRITFSPCNQLTLCDCGVEEECYMDGKCQTMHAVYECHVTSPEPQKIYFGFTVGKLKKTFKSFNQKLHSPETTLSNYMWHLKETLDITHNLKWLVVRYATLYSNISKKFLLCLYEKLVFIIYPRQYKLFK